MKLLKKSERKMHRDRYAIAMKAGGMELKRVAEFKKWKELHDGRVSVSLTIHEITFHGQTQGYILTDSLERVATQIILNKQEIVEWLKEHGYKTDKDFYREDMGMSEETWEEWNK